MVTFEEKPLRRITRKTSALNPDMVRSRSSSVKAEITHRSKVIVSSLLFEKVVLAVIVFNAIWIGVDVDWNDGNPNTWSDGPPSPVPNQVFTFVENFFCVFFLLEISVRILSHAPRKLFFTSRRQWKMNIFDFVLVVLTILDVWILSPLGNTAHLNQASMMRILRLFRLLRVSRIFSMVPELGMMVRTLAKAGRSVGSTLVLEVGLMYAFAVIFTNWAKTHNDPCFAHVDDQCMLQEYFGSIARSLVTLMQILIFDDTFAIIRPILADTWYMGCLLMIFVVLGGWTVLNMLIGIICEIITTSTSQEKMNMLEQRVREVFAMMDIDGNGTVTRAEFERPAIQQQLVKLGISKEIWENAFDILDDNGSGDFDVEEFVTMVFKFLRPPQSQDLQEINRRLCHISDAMNLEGKVIGKSKSSKSYKSPNRKAAMHALKSLPTQSLSAVATMHAPKAHDISNDSSNQNGKGTSLHSSAKETTLSSDGKEAPDSPLSDLQSMEMFEPCGPTLSPAHDHPFVPDCQVPLPDCQRPWTSSTPNSCRIDGTINGWMSTSDSEARPISSKPGASSGPFEFRLRSSSKDDDHPHKVRSPARSLSHESQVDDWRPTELDDMQGTDMQVDQERQAQEVYGKLRELGHSSEKVEEAPSPTFNKILEELSGDALESNLQDRERKADLAA